MRVKKTSRTKTNPWKFSFRHKPLFLRFEGWLGSIRLRLIIQIFLFLKIFHYSWLRNREFSWRLPLHEFPQDFFKSSDHLTFHSEKIGNDLSWTNSRIEILGRDISAASLSMVDELEKWRNINTLFKMMKRYLKTPKLT